MALSGDYLKKFNKAIEAAQDGTYKELSTRDGLIDFHVHGNLPIKLILIGFSIEGLTPKNAAKHPVYAEFAAAAQKVGKNLQPGQPKFAVSFIFELA